MDALGFRLPIIQSLGFTRAFQSNKTTDLDTLYLQGKAMKFKRNAAM